MVTVLQGLKHTHTHTHYISSRFKTHTDITFLQGLKHTHYISSRFKTHTQTHIHTRTRTHTHTHTHTLEKAVIIKVGPALASQKDRHLIFIFNMDILYLSVCSSLIIKAHIKFMFDRPQRLFSLT